MNRLQSDLETMFNPSAKKPKRAYTWKDVAIFPGGEERDIERKRESVSRRKIFSVHTPDGLTRENSVLGDLKFFLQRQYPGITFEKRKI